MPHLTKFSFHDDPATRAEADRLNAAATIEPRALGEAIAAGDCMRELTSLTLRYANVPSSLLPCLALGKLKNLQLTVAGCNACDLLAALSGRTR